MKNKKPRTIEEILLLNVEFGAKNKKVWVSKIVPQIKQLIADEVIGEDEFWADEYNTEGTSVIDVDKYKFQARSSLRELQRKKLERL